MKPPPHFVSYLARVRFRNWTQPVGIRAGDRLFHVYLIGKTGTGKSTALETLLSQDIAAGAGLALIDPHGDLAERVVARVPRKRISDLIYFDAPDPTQPFGYNPLRQVVAEARPLAAAGLLEVLKKLWDSRSWGPRMEHILRNALLALLDCPDAALPDVLRLLTERPFRREVAETSQNPQVRAFLLTEYERYPLRLRADAIAPIQNKIGAFLANPLLFRILASPDKLLSPRRIMDEGKILIANLARGRLGDDPAGLLGALLVTTIGLAAFSRASLPAEERRPFYLYVDEFQSFTTLAFANMLSELRKYGVGLVLAHQYLYQLEPEIRYAVLGNVGTLISFRLGPPDARLFAKEFAPEFDAVDLLNLPNHHVYLKLMIDGAPSKPFSGVTLRPEDAWAVVGDGADVSHRDRTA